MDIRELKPGTKMELELRDKDGKKLDFNLVSEFEWLVDEETMMIAAPIHEGTIYPIHTGTHIDVFCIHKRELEHELYTFKAVVTGREMSNNLSLLKIVLAGEIEKVQRRQYFRLGCTLPVKFRIVETMNELVNEGIEFKKTIAGNLSGGGICLLLEEKIEVGKLVECEIKTEETNTVKFYGKVVRHDQNSDTGRYKYQAGITYININNKDREAVVKYIFNEQRKLRKKGLI